MTAVSKDFKIHSIVVCKNEADVIGHCLEEATKWSDFIYCYDGVSTDGTWEIVLDLQKKYPGRIFAWKQDGKVFQESLRAEVFDAYRQKANDGDWWCQLNVDEYYIDEPRAFLAKIDPACHVVWGTNVEFYITDKDLGVIDFEQPFPVVQPQLRHYKVFHSEIRFFKHRQKLVWHLDKGWPEHLGIVAPERIRFRHYPFRSPKQIQIRLDVRRDNRARGFTGWSHASEASWKDKVANAADCQYDKQDGNYVIDESKLPHHLEPPMKRLMKRVMHGVGVWP